MSICALVVIFNKISKNQTGFLKSIDFMNEKKNIKGQGRGHDQEAMMLSNLSRNL